MSFNSRKLVLSEEGIVIIQLILYGIFGVLTTVINIVAYWFTTRVAGIAVVPSTAIAWTVAVFFAYWSNRNFVFHSSAHTFSDILTEAASFFAARITTGIIDIVIMYVFVDVLGLHDVVVKVASNILVIILNYVFSKILVFKGEKNS